MRNFSQLIKENDENKSFKYTATATVSITGNVNATNEGDAGYMIDSDLEPGTNVTGEIVNYEIVSIDEIPTEFSENIIAANGDDQAEMLYNEIVNYINEKIESSNLQDYYKSAVLTKLRTQF